MCLCRSLLAVTCSTQFSALPRWQFHQPLTMSWHAIQSTLVLWKRVRHVNHRSFLWWLVRTNSRAITCCQRADQAVRRMFFFKEKYRNKGMKCFLRDEERTVLMGHLWSRVSSCHRDVCTSTFLWEKHIDLKCSVWFCWLLLLFRFVSHD